MNTVSQREAARLAGVSQPTLHRKLNALPRPEWAVYDKKRRTWRANPEHPAFLAMIDEADEAEADALESGPLHEAARRALYELDIQKAELLRFKIEQEKISLKKAASNLTEWDFIEGLYNGYLERLQQGLRGMEQAIPGKLEPAIKAGIEGKRPPAETAGIICKLIEREVEAVLREVKAATKADIESRQGPG